MSGANIKFSPEEVENINTQIANYKESISGEVDQLHSLVIDDLCANWEGVASDKYATEFEELKSSVMDKFITMLDDLNTQLTSIVTAMTEADNDIADQISMNS